MTNILNIGKSGLNAANLALNTTGHNIANATTPGYNRQEVLQAAVAGQNIGSGYIGKGTEITTVRRVYSDFLNNQVLSATSSSSQLTTYYTQIKQIDNMLSDSSVGLSPALQEFFKGIQDLSAAASSPAARQTLLSSAETLTGRFHSMDAQLSELRSGVNAQIGASVNAINSYSSEIARLNEEIARVQNASNGNMPNDLLDQRDQAIAELSKEVKVSVVKQGSSYDIYIGNGQPLVVGPNSYKLKAVQSPSDLNRMEVAYENNGRTMMLPESSMAGGNLAALFEFRSQTLDVAQNTMGRIAIALASDINAQHQLGMDQNGAMGKAFFNIPDPVITASNKNQGSLTINDTSIVDASKLTTSNYQLSYDGANYHLTRLSDNVELASGALADVQAGAEADGFSFNIAVTGAQAGDNFLIRPTAYGASGISVAIKNVAEIAAAAPVRTSAATANAGTGTISAGVVNARTNDSTTLTYHAGPPANLTGFPDGRVVTVSPPGPPIGVTTIIDETTTVPYTNGATVSYGGVSFTLGGATLTDNSVFAIAPNFTTAPSATLTYNGGNLSGFTSSVTVTVNGTSTVYPGPVAPATTISIPYTDGATISYGGVSIVLAGTPANGDTFTVGPNTNGSGDNRNMLLMGGLQTAKTIGGKTSSYQGSYSQLVNFIGNKTAELETTSAAAENVLEQAVASEQALSGVNLDEEATNLMRYQQAYQASARIIQIAGELFDTLISVTN